MRLLLTVMIGFVTACAAQPQTPTAVKSKANSANTVEIDKNRKLSDIEELLTLLDIDRKQQQLISQMEIVFKQQADGMLSQISDSELRAKVVAQTQELQKQMLASLTQKLGFEALKQKYVQIYDETFTAEEIAGLLAFYKSSAGQAFLEKNPDIMAKTAAVVQQAMGDTQSEMQKIFSSWMGSAKANSSAQVGQK